MNAEVDRQASSPEGAARTPARGGESGDTVAGSAPAASPGYVWYVIGLLSVVNAFSYMDRMALSVLVPFIQSDLRLSDGQIGLLTGLAFSVFYAVCGIPIARLADRSVRRNIIVIALATWSIMTALSGVTRNFGHLFAARVGIGAGESGAAPASASIICDYLPLRRRATAFALHTFGAYAGMMMGMMLASRLGEIIGWRLTFVVLGLPGLGLAMIVALTLREPKRGTFDAVKARSDEGQLSFAQTVAVLWGCRTYRLIVLSFVLFGFIQYGMNQWWPSFYVRSFGLRLSVIGFNLGIALAIGSAIGLLVGGVLADRATRRDVRLPLRISAAAFVLTVPTTLAALFVHSSSLSLMLVALTTLLWAVSIGPVSANVNSVVSSRMRATANSIGIFSMSVVGYSLGPLCVGLLSDALAATLGKEALRYALTAPTGLIPLMAFLLYKATRTLPADLAAVDPNANQR